MKRMLMTASVTFSVMLLVAFQNKASAQPPDEEINYQTFYDELDPHGDWMENPDYGYVWKPNAGPDFQPYSTSGHWVWSNDYEWMWVSDYDWGWAPFHYGRWHQDPYYGWIWVPGYEWSPAWVAWRDGGDYYGWAPLRPGINISVNFSIGGYNPPIDYWCFAPRRYITSPRIYDHYAPRRNNVTIINQTTIINNYNYNRNVFRTGPGRRDAERYAGRINSVRFRDASRPGRTSFRNNEVSVYRPRVQQDNNRTYTPRRIDRSDRNGSNNNNNGNAGRPQNDNNQPRRENGINRPERNNDGPSRNENGIVRNRDRQINRDRDNDGQPDRNRTIERPDNNNTNRPDINRPNRQNGETRPFDRPNVDRPQRNIDRNNNIDRNAERPQRNFERPQRNVERPQTPNVNNERRIERRNGFGNNEATRPERRQMGAESRPQRQPQMEQRQESRQQQPRQQQQQPRQQQQQQPRQSEQRRSESGGENRGGGNRGGGFGRNR